MNTNVDEWFKGNEYKILWEENLKKDKSDIISNLDSDVETFLKEAEFVEMRIFSLPDIWGIHYKFMYKGKEFVFNTKPQLLGDFLYCNGEIITEYMNITHGEASILLELLQDFVVEELGNRGIGL